MNDIFGFYWPIAGPNYRQYELILTDSGKNQTESLNDTR